MLFNSRIHFHKLFLTLLIKRSNSFLRQLEQVSLILRGANDFMLDEMDRALHDALCIVKRTLESNTVRNQESHFLL